MKKIYEKIYVGNQNDFYSIKLGEWAVIHACKDPFHKELVGYVGNLSKEHPDYPYKEVENRLALNLVDTEFAYDLNWHSHYLNIFQYTMKFIDKEVSEGKNILIHCNQGESRGPSIGMLYLAYKGIFGYKDYDYTKIEFLKLYPEFNPKRNISENIKACWDEIVDSTTTP